jgi:6-phosphofructokinase
MTRVETIGVVGGGGGTGALNAVIRGVARAAISAFSVRVSRATFEGGA